MSDFWNYAISLSVGAAICVAFGMIMLVILYVSLALRAVARWLTGRSWNDVIVASERKAFRG